GGDGLPVPSAVTVHALPVAGDGPLAVAAVVDGDLVDVAVDVCFGEERHGVLGDGGVGGHCCSPSCRAPAGAAPPMVTHRLRAWAELKSRRRAWSSSSA